MGLQEDVVAKIRRRNSAEPVIERMRESEIARNRREEREYQPI
jgi:hypothetical protein